MKEEHVEESPAERACFRLWLYALGILSDVRQLKRAVKTGREIRLNPRAYIRDIYAELAEIQRELVNLSELLEIN